MGFQQGLSGLNAASQTLEAIGNNVANANTVGFKQSEAQFADVFASSLTGAGAAQVGIGTKVSQVAQQFTQGNITGSNNPLDVAINGGGFYRMSINGTVQYTRNGQFQLNKDGFIVNAQGAELTGYLANSAGVLATGNTVPLFINTANIPPQVTTKASEQLNLNSTEAVAAGAFNPSDSTTFNRSTSISVFDSLGNSHLLQTYFKKTAAGTWDVYATNDGTVVTTTPAGGKIGTLNFKSDGTINTTTTTLPFAATMTVTTGATTPLAVNMDFTGTTQFGASFSVNAQTQDGNTTGRLSSFNIGADGTITGEYTNGKAATLGQVVLANFTNPNGLQSLGNNAWAETADSGVPLVSTPSTGSLGVLQSSAVEDSNADLTAELVNMITAQRNYQANAQSIKTQDQVLQTLVTLGG